MTTDVIIGGYCGSAAGYECLRAAMQDTSGNNTIFVESRRWGLMFPRGGRDYPRPLFRQAQHVANVLRARGIWSVRLYGHSMGAAIALIFADEFGASFGIEQVTALSPACLYTDGTLSLARRMLAKGQADKYDMRHHRNAQVRQIIRAGQPGALRYLSNPVRCAAEGLALAGTTLFDLVCPRLAESKIPVAVGYAGDDLVFARGPVEAAIKELPGITSFVMEGTPHDVQYLPSTTAAALRRHGVL